MSAIFISHSSKDNAWAERIAAWLKELGHQSLFLDFDPQNGIPAGSDWEKQLHHRLRRCRAVIALLSEHFAASDWCKGEAWIASNLGKSLFPVRVGPCELPQMLRSFQAIDLTTDPEAGFRRLARGLAEAGLDAKDIFQWDSSRPPYPGLMAFQEADAPVFFGRDREIQEGLDRLHNLRRYGGKALLLALGASGCGKSSLVRAGIVPRLRRDPEGWLVLDPFRPGTDPFAELADVLGKAFRAVGEKPPALPTTAQELKNQLEDLRRRGGHRDASTVIVIDQFEELLAGQRSGSDRQPEAAGEPAGSTPAERFLAFLAEVTGETDGRLVVLATLRSDFLGSFQSHPSLVGVPFDDLKLGPMEAPAYARVIAGPAEVAGLQLEPGLTDRMVADARTGDALPLLAFTLRELLERYGKVGDLTLTEYEHLGGLEGSVQRAADAVLAARALSAEEEEALRRAFLQLCRINEEGQHARITAQWEAMPPASKETLQRLVDARLLVSGKDNGTIEVAHEALLRTWPLLKGWLEESREFLFWKSRFQGALGEYERSGTLVVGKPLEEAEGWRTETAEESAERRLIDVSLDTRLRRRRRNRLLAGGAGLALVGFTGGLWWQLNTIRQWQTEVFIGTHQRMITSDPMESIISGLAAMGRSVDDNRGLSIFLSESLSRASSNNFSSGPSISSGLVAISSMIVLRNGDLLMASEDGTLQRQRDGMRVGEIVKTNQGRIFHLLELGNADIAILGIKDVEILSDGPGPGGAFTSPIVDGMKRIEKIGQQNMHILRNGQTVIRRMDTGNHDVIDQIWVMRDGDAIIVGRSGRLLRLREGMGLVGKTETRTSRFGGTALIRSLERRNGDLVAFFGDGRMLSVPKAMGDGKLLEAPVSKHQAIDAIELRNGDLITIGRSGEYLRWRNGKPSGAAVDTKQDGIYQLIELNNGDLLSSGLDGSLRLIRDDMPILSQISHGQGLAKIAQLRDGQVITGGQDGSLRSWSFSSHPKIGFFPEGLNLKSILKLKNEDLLTVGQNGDLRRWRNGRQVGVVIKTGINPVIGVLEQSNGDLLIGGDDGVIHGLSKDNHLREVIRTGHDGSYKLVELGQELLVSAGVDGTLRWWKNGKILGQPVQTGQGAIWALAVTDEGALVTGGIDGTIRFWKDRLPLGSSVKPGGGPIINLFVLRNGDLVSSHANDRLMRWKKGKLVGESLLTMQDLVISLVELENGDLISGGRDGTIQRIRDWKLIGPRTRTVHDSIVKLVYSDNALLLVGVDGKSSAYSPMLTAKSICLGGLENLLRNPVTLVQKEASSVCKRFGFF